MKMLSVMFVAGDPSGDEHASAVIRALHKSDPAVCTFGIGGPNMQAAGFEPVLPFEPFNRMGFAEVIRHLPFFLGAKARCVSLLKERKPSVLVCVDYPGFNIPLMKSAKKLGIPVVWYIVPQVWAWKKKRAKILGENASSICVVFPFEAAYFSPYPAPVTFVGHPLVELIDKLDTDNKKATQDTTLRLALVPGSRPQEIAYMLDPMVDAAIELKRKYPALTVTVSKCKSLPDAPFTYQKKRFDAIFGESLAISGLPLSDILLASDYAIVTSGTATLHTALMTVPMVIAYKTSGVTYSLLKQMITLPYIGLPNIVAQEKIVPECIQADVDGHKLADAIAMFIDNKEYCIATIGKLGDLKKKLGSKVASEEVAKKIIAASQSVKIENVNRA